jgi:hypothetical protein
LSDAPPATDCFEAPESMCGDLHEWQGDPSSTLDQSQPDAVL